MIRYPYKKVIIWFSLCPALYGVVSFMVSIYYGFAGVIGDSGFFMLIVFSLVLSALSAVVAAVICFPVAFALGLFYAVCKLNRGWVGCLTCFFTGGSGSYLWWYFIYPYRESGYINSVFSGSSIYNGASAFFMGALFSLVVSFWALPSRPVLLSSLRRG